MGKRILMLMAILGFLLLISGLTMGAVVVTGDDNVVAVNQEPDNQAANLDVIGNSNAVNTYGSN